MNMKNTMRKSPEGIRKVGLFLMFLCLTCLKINAQEPLFDVLIKNAMVFDGSGGDSVPYDVGIKGDRIAFVGKPDPKFEAQQIIDGKGLYLSPGFIDPHTHYLSELDHNAKEHRALLRALMQGVTTVFVGNDGTSPLPIKKTLKGWEKNGIGPNAALFIGHNSIRKKVIGTRNIKASLSQMNAMKGWVKRSMRAGAFGISTGLFYNPGNFASTEEVVELSKVAARYGGIYDTHQRDEGSQNIGVVHSTKEVLDIAEKAHIPVHFSHIKVAGPNAWGKSNEIIALIEEAQEKGLKVTANQYPYIASKTALSSALIPAWVRDGGVSAMRKRLENIELRDRILKGIHEGIQARTADPSKLILASDEEEFLNGKSLAELAEIWSISAEEVVVRACAESAPSVYSFMMKAEDVENFMVQPWVMTGSDGGGGHPRGFGTFARVIREYALNRKLLSVSKAIHRSTHLTAKTLQVKDRGLIKEGYFADLLLFNPREIQDNATYDNGQVLASGVLFVIVNGTVVIQDGEWQEELTGRALRLNSMK